MSPYVSFDSQAAPHDASGVRDPRDPREPGESRAPFESRIRTVAAALGFDAVGIARADLPLEKDHERWREFVRAGMHGDMAWLAENGEARLRVDGEEILPGAKSVICVARRYQRAGGDEREDAETARAIARYARGQDYHVFLRKRVRRLAAFVRTLGTPEAPVHARPMIDDAPVLERAWAARAGLGFVGKNGIVIVPGLGSMVLLGEVVTTLALVPDEPIEERCGSCTRCLDACPTNAFAQPFVLDARKCVSYLTIEHRGAIDPELREGVGEHLFGCDDCQTVCPFNRARANEAKTPDAVIAASLLTRTQEERDRFAPLERWSTTRLESLLALAPDAPGWDALATGTPVHRATASGLARNAAIVLGNRGESGENVTRSAEALRAAASAHPDQVVREAAAWALAKIERG